MRKESHGKPVEHIDIANGRRSVGAVSIDTSVGRVEGVRVSIDTSVQVSGQGSGASVARVRRGAQASRHKLRVPFVASHDNLADFFTKPLNAKTRGKYGPV